MSYDIINLLKLEEFHHMIDSISSYRIDNIIYIDLSFIDSKTSCPICQCSNIYKHGNVTKKIVHSITNHSKCIILYKAKRYRCKLCKKTYLENNPLSFRYDSISIYTKMEILNALRNYNQTFTQVANQFQVSIQKVVDVFDQHVDCKRLFLPKILCIDEIYTARISAYKYACVLLDFKNSQIIDIIPTRHKSYLRYYLGTLCRKELHQVKYVIMDMYEPYKDLITSILPKAMICIDSFHVIRQLNEAIKRIRIDIMNQYKDNKSFEHTDYWYYMLKKFHYFFLKDFDSIYEGLIYVARFKSKWNKYEIREYLLSIDKDLKAAYYLKEAYRQFNKHTVIMNDEDRQSAVEQIKDFIYKFRNSKFESFRAFGETLTAWETFIINSFTLVEKRRLSNGPIEGMNSKIKTIIKISNGMRNFNRFRNRCMFSLNKKTPIK